MLSEFPDTVEASSNLAQVQAGEGHISVRFLVRSSSDSRKMWVASSIAVSYTHLDVYKRQFPRISQARWLM